MDAEYTLKKQILAEAVKNILKAKAKKYEDLAKKCRECSEHMEDYLDYAALIGKRYHHKNATGIYAEVIKEESADLLTPELIKMLMERHEKTLNDAMGEAQRTQDEEARGQLIKEISEAIRELPRIEDLYNDYCDGISAAAEA